MSGGFSARNGALLRKRFPGLLESLEGVSADSPAATVVPSAAGDPTLQADGVWVHSRVDPRREAERLAAIAAGEGPLVVLGFGLGYAAEAAGALDATRPLIVVEKEPRLLAAAIDSRDLSGILSREALAFVVGGPPAGVLAALDTLGGKPSILSNRALRALAPAWYDEAENAVRAWTAKEDVNAATLRRFGTRWVRNLARNLETIRDLPGVATLAGCAEDFPALLVAAGPSLDEALPSLKRIAERCLIVAVDTSLRAVLSAGVDPDFVVVVDPQYWNARHLDRCAAPRAALVSESAVYPTVPRAEFSRAFLCSSLFPLGRFVEDAVDPKGTLGAGGSVATTAWDFLRFIGARPVWAAGLDLSFPGLKTHFKGALFEERVHSEARRTAPGELWSFRALRDGKPFAAPAADGGTVLTDQRLSLYASWFENRFRMHPGAAPLSLSRRGLRIGGMAQRSLEELSGLPVRRAEMDRRLSAVFAEIDRNFGSPAERERRRSAYELRVRELEAGLEELTALSESAAAEARKALGGTIGDDALRILDGFNARIAASAAKDVAGFLFPPTADLEREMPPGLSDPLRSHVEFSRLLYERLAESARFNLRLLKSGKKG